MPEGDTIHRAAGALRRALVGHDLVEVAVPRRPAPWPALGAHVTWVQARGKHLLIRTSDGLIVHTHQRMTGSWHLYRPGERWRKARGAARVVLATASSVAVCFSSPVVEILDDRSLQRHPTLRRLGPDLLDPATELGDVLERVRTMVPADRAVGEVLLDQRIACGIGNVYRCDVLFLHGLAPTLPIGSVDAATREQLFATARDLLTANVEQSTRTTVDGGPPGALWVHGRAGRPCRRCGTPIVLARLGDQARHAYWCPRCQPGGRRH